MYQNLIDFEREQNVLKKTLQVSHSLLSRRQKLTLSSPPFQVSSMELVQEIHQLLMDREDTCHRTCFSLHLAGSGGGAGTTLDNFAELKSVEGLKVRNTF